MNDSLIRERFAVMNNAYSKYSFEYFLSSMERLGLNKIDLWGGVQHFNVLDATPQSVDRFGKRLRAHGMKAVAYTPEILGYPLNFASPDTLVRGRSIAYGIKNLEIAAALEIPLMLTNPGWACLDQSHEDALCYSADSLAELAVHAQRQGVKLVLEHLTIQSSTLLNRAVDMQRTLERVNSPWLNCILDLGQMSVFEESVDDYFDLVGEQILHVHIMDGAPEGHLAFGDGVLPLHSYFEQLNRRSYAGHITLEINDGRYANDPHAALEQCVHEISRWQEV